MRAAPGLTARGLFGKSASVFPRALHGWVEVGVDSVSLSRAAPVPSSGSREHRSGRAGCRSPAKGLCTQAAIVWSRKSVLPTDRKGWGRIRMGMSAREGEMMSRQP